jgi:hypothetical protein
VTDPVVPTKPAARWEDFIDIFYAPDAVFRRRQNESFWPPLLIVSLLTGVVAYFTFDAMAVVFEGQIRASMAEAARQNPMNADQVAAVQKWGMLSAKIASVVFTPFVIGLLGLGTWLVGKLFGSEQTFNGALVVVSYAYVIRVIGAIAAGAQALTMDLSGMKSPYALALGPGRYLDPETTSPLLYALAARLDLFTIWVTVLIGIGYVVTGKMTRGGAFGAALLLWVLGGLGVYRGVLMSRTP